MLRQAAHIGFNLGVVDAGFLFQNWYFCFVAAMADSDVSKNGAVRRFSGEKPEEYKAWRKWARAWIKSKNIGEDARGSALVTLLTGAAFKAIQEVDDD